MRNGGADTLHRWLVVLPWQLRDVQLFLVDADTGAILTHPRAGLGLPRADLVIDTVHPTFLVDQFMPYLDGWGFLRGVRESVQHQDLPVVLISAAPRQPPAAFPP